VARFVDEITIYTRSGDANKNAIKLSGVLQVSHEWAKNSSIEFDYGDRLGFLHIRTRFPRQEKKAKKWKRKLVIPEERVPMRSPQKSLKLLGVSFNSKFSFAEHAENVISKVKKAASAIGRLRDVFRGITGQTIRWLYVSCVRPVKEYASPVLYKRILKAHKDKFEGVQNLALRRVLEAFKSTAACILQRDTRILPFGRQARKLGKRFALKAFRSVDPRNLVMRLVRWQQSAAKREQLGLFFLSDPSDGGSY
jgi:hypothetical protein